LTAEIFRSAAACCCTSAHSRLHVNLTDEPPPFVVVGVNGQTVYENTCMPWGKADMRGPSTSARKHLLIDLDIWLVSSDWLALSKHLDGRCRSDQCLTTERSRNY
jgi:hypothetical protein